MITYKNQKIYTDAREQTAPSGRKFYLSAVTKNTKEPEIFDKTKKAYLSKCIYNFKYLDNKKEGFIIETDYNGKVISFTKFVK